MTQSSIREIDEQIAALEAKKAQIREQAKVDLRIEHQKALDAAGLSFSDVWGVAPSRGKSTPSGGLKTPPKFASPSDPSLTWGGRGKRPEWFKAALSRGVTEDQMLIK